MGIIRKLYIHGKNRFLLIYKYIFLEKDNLEEVSMHSVILGHLKVFAYLYLLAGNVKLISFSLKLIMIAS